MLTFSGHNFCCWYTVHSTQYTVYSIFMTVGGRFSHCNPKSSRFSLSLSLNFSSFLSVYVCIYSITTILLLGWHHSSVVSLFFSLCLLSSGRHKRKTRNTIPWFETNERQEIRFLGLRMIIPSLLDSLLRRNSQRESKEQLKQDVRLSLPFPLRMFNATSKGNEDGG